ncbi:PREDICTED: protein CREG1 [Dinoponera quadriceps]|uniref:Protein CREG1 n=1 Tax=Dinoponera quadriceps TaxID=609295 RepID=A0A6P3WX65_DINQU|nr:PREDICTED: protein CREG1 [Dinoponera quadriceps]
MRAVSIIIIVSILISERNKIDAKPNDEQWKEFEEFLNWKQEKEQRKYDTNYNTLTTQVREIDGKDHNQVVLDPPPMNEAALMARYIVNQADWTAVATISTRRDVATFPVANIIALADGQIGSGSGIPYVYLTHFDFTAQDLAVDHRATLLVTLAQGNYCKSKDWDPMDPRCGRVFLTGTIKALMDNTTAEYVFAKQAIFGRHPHLKNMPEDHHFFIAKLKISAIAMVDNFGGPKYIAINDYLHPAADNIEEGLQRFLMEQASRENFNSKVKLPIYEARRV